MMSCTALQQGTWFIQPHSSSGKPGLCPRQHRHCLVAASRIRSECLAKKAVQAEDAMRAQVTRQIGPVSSRRNLMSLPALMVLLSSGLQPARAEESTSPTTVQEAAGASGGPVESSDPPTGSSPAPDPAPTPTIYAYNYASDVPSNLRPKQYMSIIRSNRTAAWVQIAQQIQNKQYEALSMNLGVTPFADIRQAALYLPWAILQNNDFQAAIEARKGSNDFEDHVGDLQRISLAAAANPDAADATRIQQAFILLSQSLDTFLASIPVKYNNN